MKKPAPLVLRNIAVVGHSGGRDNIEKLLAVQALFLPPGTVLMATITHDSACPCADGKTGMTHCLCEHVDVRLDTQQYEDVK